MVVCRYCQKRAKRVTGEAVYPHRPDLADMILYRCDPCDAHVGCHPGTDIPLGELANGHLRYLRRQAHSAFDPIWRTGEKGRRDAYRWLAEQLGIPFGVCHIGQFDIDMCKRVIAVCRERVEA